MKQEHEAGMDESARREIYRAVGEILRSSADGAPAAGRTRRGRRGPTASRRRSRAGPARAPRSPEAATERAVLRMVTLGVLVAQLGQLVHPRHGHAPYLSRRQKRPNRSARSRLAAARPPWAATNGCWKQHVSGDSASDGAWTALVTLQSGSLASPRSPVADSALARRGTDSAPGREPSISFSVFVYLGSHRSR